MIEIKCWKAKKNSSEEINACKMEGTKQIWVSQSEARYQLSATYSSGKMNFCVK